MIVFGIFVIFIIIFVLILWYQMEAPQLSCYEQIKSFLVKTDIKGMFTYKQKYLVVRQQQNEMTARYLDIVKRDGKSQKLMDTYVTHFDHNNKFYVIFKNFKEFASLQQQKEAVSKISQELMVQFVKLRQNLQAEEQLCYIAKDGTVKLCRYSYLTPVSQENYVPIVIPFKNNNCFVQAVMYQLMAMPEIREHFHDNIQQFPNQFLRDFGHMYDMYLFGVQAGYKIFNPKQCDFVYQLIPDRQMGELYYAADLFVRASEKISGEGRQLDIQEWKQCPQTTGISNIFQQIVIKESNHIRIELGRISFFDYEDGQEPITTQQIVEQFKQQQTEARIQEAVLKSSTYLIIDCDGNQSKRPLQILDNINTKSVNFENQDRFYTLFSVVFINSSHFHSRVYRDDAVFSMNFDSLQEIKRQPDQTYATEEISYILYKQKNIDHK